jgi:hypothetical protein
MIVGSRSVVLPMRARRRVRTVAPMHEAMTPSSRRGTRIAAASLIVGPLLMSVGDLMHPSEDMDPSAQATILIEDAARWYGAHLLLLLGAAVLVPGILALTAIAAERRPSHGGAERILLVVGLAALSAIFACEMLVGRYASDGASVAATADLLRTLQSPAVLGILGGLGSAFFVGVAAFTVPLIRGGAPWRAPAVVFALGALLVLVEIVSAQVVFSQVGNILMAVASATFAFRLLNGGALPREAGALGASAS